MGYGLLSAGTSKLLLQALETHKFNIVIIDESHYLKTRRAARTQQLHQLCKKAKHAILLSGTPSLARPREVCHFCPAIKLISYLILKKPRLIFPYNQGRKKPRSHYVVKVNFAHEQAKIEV